jgi:hypothetical protein
MRRLVAALVIILVIFGAAWVAGWFWLANLVQARTGPALQQIADRGIEVSCPDRKVVGFPFAVRVRCGATDVAQPSTSTTASLAGATGGASVFRPMTAVVALDSPVRVQSPLLAGPVEFRWEDAAVDVGMGFAGPQTLSFRAADFLGAFALPGNPEETVAAERAAAHLSPSASGGSDVKVTFRDLALTSGGKRFPPVSGNAAAELSIPPRALASGRAGITLPVEARGIDVELESGGARFLVEGDMTLRADGKLDGTMVLRVTGAEALPDVIAALPPEFQKIGNAVAAGLFAFGQPTKIDGKQGSEVRVAIKASHAEIGPIAFDLPRLKL